MATEAQNKANCFILRSASRVLHKGTCRTKPIVSYGILRDSYHILFMEQSQFDLAPVQNNLIPIVGLN